ncbi:ASCH domain-containing protein [Candidatus Pacearchaeota archaeon]|nr:ASCH domain-containing protein [Candidatus Pacearchaeota archaeon]
MGKIRALSIHQPYGSWIVDGSKTLEVRTRNTNIRGDVLICSTKSPEVDGLPTGKALCIVNITGSRRMRPEDEEAARVDYCSNPRGPQTIKWVWILEDLRPIKEPFDVTGAQGWYYVDLPEEYAHLVKTGQGELI